MRDTYLVREIPPREKREILTEEERDIWKKRDEDHGRESVSLLSESNAATTTTLYRSIQPEPYNCTGPTSYGTNTESYNFICIAQLEETGRTGEKVVNSLLPGVLGFFLG